jgi:hypothetical protein
MKRFHRINAKANITESLAQAKSLRHYTEDLINVQNHADVLVENDVSN